jgi:hypothetical protein
LERNSSDHETTAHQKARKRSREIAVKPEEKRVRADAAPPHLFNRAASLRA